MMNNNIGKVFFWCQKVLPLVYDNSLSYYEVLCKFQKKVNELVDNINAIPEYIDDKVKEAFDDEHLRELISEVFRTIEDAITANNEGTNTHFSTDYPTVGTLVWHDNKLYRTIHAIDEGDAIIPDSNIELVNFGDMFSEFLTEVKTRFTDNDDGLRETSSSDRPVHDLVWLKDELYEVIKPIAEGNAYIYSGANKNVDSTNLDKIYDYLLDLISSEIDAREEAIEGVESDIHAVELLVQAEATARDEADTLLQGNIDNEVTNRENADINLNDKIELEIEHRVDADTDLNDKIELEISKRHDEDELLNSGLYFFRNKKIAIFGDSLSDETVMSPNWVARLRTATTNLNCTIDNYSVGGMGICSNLPSQGGLIDIIDSVTTIDYDMIIIFIGVNDRNNKIAYGASGDTNRTTFYGGINEMYNHIISKFSNTPVYYVNIPQITHMSSDGTYPPINGYRAIIQHCCNHFGWYKVDITTRLPYYTPQSPVWNDISDGLHVKPSYSQQLMDVIVKQISEGGVDAMGSMPEVINYDSIVSGLTGNCQLIVDTNGDFEFGVFFSDIDVSIRNTQVIVNNTFPVTLFEVGLMADNTVKSAYLYKDALYVNLPNKATWALASSKYSLLSAYPYNN